MFRLGFKDEDDRHLYRTDVKLVVVLRSRSSGPEMSRPALSGSGQGCNCCETSTPGNILSSSKAEAALARAWGAKDRTFGKESQG